MRSALDISPTPRGLVRNRPRAVRRPFLMGCATTLLAWACSGSQPSGALETSGNGGAPGTMSGGGTSTSPAAGGQLAVGGSVSTLNTESSAGHSAASGGRASGGAFTAGASQTAAGASSTGATSSNTGGTKTGPTTRTGGSVSTGGIATGGSTSATATGGVRATGGGASAGGASVAGGAVSTGGAQPVGGVSAAGGVANTGGVSASCPSTYSNPVIWQDLPDVEVIRVDDTYYYTASTFHYSPGAPVLRSYDLVNWDYIGHSVPVLDFDASYDLSGKRSYVNGIWASSLRYRKSNNTFYWIGCMHNVGGGYVFTATTPEGPWTKHPASCYYDVGLLIDDDDTMYVAYGNTTISVAQLSKDGFSQVKSQKVFDSPADIGPLEGSRFYRINGDYYIFTTQYANGEYVLRSSSGPFGPYTLQKFAVKLPFAGAGAGASPHQGGIVQTQNGDWYYMAFNDSYPAGRIPVLAPVTWSNGWPSVTLVNGSWGASYPFPNLPCGAGRVKPMTGTDTFSESTLEPYWEWNHNPDNTKWSAGAGLTLQTATVTSDLYAARNTLTRRMIGPTSTATIELDYSAMKDGDVAGLAALRDSSAWIGVKRASGSYRVVMVNNLTLDSSWNTSSKGTEVASGNVSGGKIWLRIAANIRTDNGGGQATFSYSTNGTQFTQLGSAFTMKKEWQFFLGYRYAIFNYAGDALGGSIKVTSFQLATP